MDFSSFLLPGLFLEEAREEDERILDLATEQALFFGELGFNPWSTEHHFRGAWQSNPLQFLSYVAAKLPKDTYLGFGVLTVPYYHPVRLVESMNLLDQLTKGGTLFGLGSGLPGVEPPAFGLEREYHTSGRAMTDSFEIVERLWDYKAGDPAYEFDTPLYRGRVTKRVVPSPYRGRRPTIIRTARNDEALLRAATNGWPVFLGTFGADIAEQSRTYRRALAESEHPADVVSECLRWSTADWLAVIVADSNEEALRSFDRARAERLERRERFWKNNDIPGPIGAHFREGADMANPIAGTPDVVSEQLQQLADLGVNHLVTRFLGEWRGQTHSVIEKSMRLFAEEVMPRFKDITPLPDLLAAAERVT